MIASWRDQEYIPQQFTSGESVGGDSPRKFDKEPTERIGQKETISPPSHIIRQMAEQGRRASEPNISRFAKKCDYLLRHFFRMNFITEIAGGGMTLMPNMVQ